MKGLTLKAPSATMIVVILVIIISKKHSLNANYVK